ncbi:MAG: hypothetical protein NDJ94_11730 [Vicinamibacteria bacterium]|nr:hypothetical protein [Vicinamibacteria bacterium]
MSRRRRIADVALVAAGLAWTGCWFWAFSFGFSDSFFEHNRHSRIPPLIAATLAAAGIFTSFVVQWRRSGSIQGAFVRHVAGVVVAMGPFLILPALLRHAPRHWRPSADDAMGIGIDFLVLTALAVASAVVLPAALGLRNAWRARGRR